MVEFLRSPRTASRIFNTTGYNQLTLAVPRVKFLFFVEFNLSAAAISMLNNAQINSMNDPQNIAFKVKSIEKPKINLQVDELNQYNKKYLVYKKVDYQETSIKFHDSNDNSLLSFWVNYFTYFFGDSRPKNQVSSNQSPVDPLFNDDTGWGVRTLTNETKFFNSIRVLVFFANTYTAFKFMNPKITSIDWDSSDYNSSEFESVSMNLKYEFLQYEAFGKPIGFAGYTGKYGFTQQDTLPTTATGVIIPSSIQPRIFDDNIGVSRTFSQTVAPAPTSQLVTRSFFGREKTVNVATQKDNLNYVKSFFSPTQPPASFGGQTPNFGPVD
jgi:hypothetical protein